jgi:hypothetical protein
VTDTQLELAVRAGVAGERELLSAFADNYRAIFRAKVSGLSEADARRSPVPTGTSIDGNLPDRPAGEFFPTDDDTVESLLAEYDAQCEISRQIAAATPGTPTW